MGISVGDDRKQQQQLLGLGTHEHEIVVIPWPAQGHINPSLAFAKCLASKAAACLRITLITTNSIAKSATFSHCTPSISICSVSDGSEHLTGPPETIHAYFHRFRTLYRRNLEQFIDHHCAGATAIIYDSIMPWVLDIAKERGLLAASFFTQPCAVSAVFYHMGQGSLNYPYQSTPVELPALPPLQKRYLPSFHHVEMDPDLQDVIALLTNQFSNLERADWVFFNTFDQLETQIIEWMRERWAITTVGPTFLLQEQEAEEEKLDHNVVWDKRNHGISLFEPKQEACIEWLNSKDAATVVYVSFGSIASIDKNQMEEVAHALIDTACYFLWVVRSSELHKLPQDFSSEGKGLIVEWCHQPEVLRHPAVACFMTHCGWNSTLEALSSGVPLIPMAQWVDQNTNAKFIEDVWRVGVGVEPAGENGIFGREEIASCIRKVVGGEWDDEVAGAGAELKRNASHWKNMATQAVGKGGTSANNVDHFLSKIVFHNSGDNNIISPTSVLD